MKLKDTALHGPGKDATELVVVIHGWGLPRDRYRDLFATVREQKPQADILAPVYPSGWISRIDPLLHPDAFATSLKPGRKPLRRLLGGPWRFMRSLIAWLSRASPTAVTEAFLTAITDATNEKSYERITIVGHSIGALIARKVFLFARGHCLDSADPQRNERSWFPLVTRLILISSMNRGWRLSAKPQHMNWVAYFFFRLITPIVRTLTLGRLIFGLERGAPFVANLRLQWIRLNRTTTVMPTTVFILGAIDNMMSADDHKDMHLAGATPGPTPAGAASPKAPTFFYRRIDNAGHYDILRFEDSTDGKRRKAAFVDALTGQSNALTTDLDPYTPDTTKATVTDVVFIRHGIRDYGHWTQRFRNVIDSSTSVWHSGVKVVAETTAYRRLSIFRFLLSFGRQGLVRDLMDQYTEVVAMYAKPDLRIGFIGHSHGTLLAARVLREYVEAHFNRVAFAGSIVPRDFEWKKIVDDQARVAQVRNDLASFDVPVGVLARFFEWLRESFLFFWIEIGSGGFQGFLANAGQTATSGYFKGGHGRALDAPNDLSLLEFVIDGRQPDDQKSPNWTDDMRAAWKVMKTDKQHWLVALLSNQCWMVAVLVVLAGWWGFGAVFAVYGTYGVLAAAALLVLILSTA